MTALKATSGWAPYNFNSSVVSSTFKDTVQVKSSIKTSPSTHSETRQGISVITGRSFPCASIKTIDALRIPFFSVSVSSAVKLTEKPSCRLS